MKESDLQISKVTREKAEATKKYIEKKYSMNQIKAEQKAENWKNFQEKLRQMHLSSSQEDNIKKEVIHEEMNELRRKRQKVSRMSFESIAIIGRGAFGEVRLCREIKNGRIVAIKCLKKKEMLKKNQQNHVRDERNILADGCEWIVKLLYSFQDQTYLYLVMEFLIGGDLMTLLIEKNVISENEARFYAAETIVAIESIHKMGYIHRDLKPDNILLDSSGHIKLSDFGLCKQAEINNEDYYHEDFNKSPKFDFQGTAGTLKHYKMVNLKKKNRKLAYSAVGTPDYIAPEMLTRKGYNETVDWWSIGIMIYEMLIGYAPFSAESNEEIYYKIQNHENFLFFPPEVNLSEDVIDLISRLVTDEKIRLGNNGVAEIQKHKWFRGINWENIKKMRPPFIPETKTEIDTKYFDKYDEKEPWIYNPNFEIHKKDFNFVGYTYKEEEAEENNQAHLYNKAIEKAEAEKKVEIEKEKEWLDLLRNNMKKKKIINPQDTKLALQKKIDKITEKSCLSNMNRSELYTDRSRQGIKSKSPLGEKDINIIKKRESKSPLETQKSTSYLRKSPIINNAFFQQTQPIPRSSLNSRK